MMHRRVLLAVSALGVASLGACSNDELFSPAVPAYAGGALFQRFVSMGNSITAGFQSAGIDSLTQTQSYAQLVAGAMGSPYYFPTLVMPGCPPPLTNVFTQTRLGGAAAPPCSYRSPNVPPFLTNVAVPGATTFDPISSGPTISSNVLTQLILGGRSQVEAAAAAQPTFISIWIGNNDVLGAATDTAYAGNPAEITPVALFTAHYDSMLTQLAAIPTLKGGILIGVADVATIPYFSYGFYYFGAFLGAKLPPTMVVLPNCAPRSSGGIGDTVLVPFRYGFGLIAAAQAGAHDTLDCTNQHSIQPAALANIHTTVALYNDTISARAATKNWAYFDPNVALLALRLPTDTVDVKPFPYTPPDTAAVTRPFGKAFSLDGVHPSAATHKLIATTLIQIINAKYGSAIP